MAIRREKSPLIETNSTPLIFSPTLSSGPSFFSDPQRRARLPGSENEFSDLVFRDLIFGAPRRRARFPGSAKASTAPLLFRMDAALGHMLAIFGYSVAIRRLFANFIRASLGGGGGEKREGRRRKGEEGGGSQEASLSRRLPLPPHPKALGNHPRPSWITFKDNAGIYI